MPTIITALSYMGPSPSVHFAEPRFLSVRELARMQGFLDSDQFTGKPKDHIKQIGKLLLFVNHVLGNAVARCVAFSLGLGLAPNVPRSHGNDPHIAKPNSSDRSKVYINGISSRIPIQALRGSFDCFVSELIRCLPPDKAMQPFRLLISYGREGPRWLIDDDTSLNLAGEAYLRHKPKNIPYPEIWYIPIVLGPDLTEKLVST
ncbi:hypothetical protein DSO57_1034338 [Entomophthora muscae]|uniref:Uncharacterized protein n=1 Tax=Entomophthora muscae TaxID=34485 RepID=A0ACC2SCI6_9FUNG|nr:hypothetical protein DSO57_1034338 [Entomophthora muscae]